MTLTRKNGKANVIVRELRPSDFKEVIDNYYSMYDEAERDPWAVGILLFETKPSLKDERKWFKEAIKRATKGDGLLWSQKLAVGLSGCVMLGTSQFRWSRGMLVLLEYS